ncbi:MAG: bifunctional 2-polyprenyl-6-hydroxyphenol methylase/3-demethylubiquinol 3-O-methyltransferase UbiG [Alphaproteobacteria bacterium]|nr:bifunctional 2-polyprenyl-6-hydroxyphenol methylase/3-demethylubiquinol 3-O-methyltransferase UbiG [Alphaproteobacteria bacterium]
MDPTSADPDRRTSVDPDEIARFAALAEAWWDSDGKFRALHRFNPPRLAYIRDRLCRHFGRGEAGFRPFDGLAILDIGCGGGLVAEPMARLGASVTGIDATARNIGVARAHAEAAGLAIDYRHAAAEDLVAEGRRYDVVLTLEVVEHVAEVGPFLADCARLVAPGGALVCATLNRTARAFALAIVGAEYVLGWLPRGTHDWRKFVRPSELVGALRPHGITVVDLAGMIYDPLDRSWRIGRDLAVNYLAFGAKAGGVTVR